MMTLDRAATLIENAWFAYLDAKECARDAFLEEYNKEMWDTYYRECCERTDEDDPVDYDEYVEIYERLGGVDAPELQCSDNDDDDYDPSDEVLYYRY